MLPNQSTYTCGQPRSRTTPERRKHPRILKKLPLKVKVNSYNIVTETLNISASGAYCEIDRYIAPMTKVGLILLVPLRLKNNKTVTRKLSCEGVLVRIEKSKSSEGKFNIAIFFTHMKEPDLKNISRYVESHLLPPS